MEAIEFFVLNGLTYWCVNGKSRQLTANDRDAVSYLFEKIASTFPLAMERLEELYKDSKPNRRYFEFRVVDRFIRCNFGEADFMHPDVEKDIFTLEEVKCPLRNICEHEGVICKPDTVMGIKGEERKVAILYAKGYLPKEIAAELGKSELTCKTQLHRICKKLKLPHPRWIIRLFNSYSL